MTKQRFFTHENMVSDTEMIIPVTLWQNKDQQQKFCDELNNMDGTINNLSEHLEKALQNNVNLNNRKNIAISELYTENRELKQLLNEILLKTEYRTDCNGGDKYSVTVQVTSRTYNSLTELLKRGEIE